MNTKQILIRIKTILERQGIDAAKAALQQFGRGIAGGVRGIQSGFAGITSGIKGAIVSLTGWNSIFGRVTLGMLTWAAWRQVVSGFQAIVDAMVGGNAKMQTALNTFQALAGGSREAANTYIEMLRQVSIETGARFDTLLENAKRLPTQVGQNFQAFSELTRMAIVLGMIDPIQGVEGAFFALSNAMEGTAQGFRSLVQRFEISSMRRVNAVLKETGSAMETLRIIFEEAGIDVDKFINQQLDTLPVAFNGIIAMLREFFRVLGEPLVTRVTEDLVRLRDWLQQNQAAVQGLASALGEGLAGAGTRFRNFLGDILGLGDFSPMRFFEAGVEMMTNLADGMFSALTDYVLPTVVQIAEAIANFFIGASPPPMGPLSEIREGGQETIKQYVMGLVEGLSSETIKGMAQEIIDNIINLEAQETQQEKSIHQLENWVDDAEKAVRAARDRLQLFDIQTADIPERFTRGRRRQLELAILAAEQEARRRKEALDAAKEQLKATKEFLQVQRRILRTLEQQAKAREKEEKAAEDAAKKLDKSFKPVEGFDPEEFKRRVAAWKDIFRRKLEPLFEEFRELFADLADFARGAFGADPDAVRGITEMFTLGRRLREALGEIKQGLDNIAGSGKEFLTELKTAWDALDPNLQKLILTILAGIAIPKLALAAGVALTIKDPGSIKGLVLLLLGLAGTTPGIFTLIVSLVGVAKGLLTFLVPHLLGLAATPLLLPLILAAEIYFGREELSKWISGERTLELKTIIKVLGFRGAQEEIQKGTAARISQLTGAAITESDVEDLLKPGGFLKVFGKIGMQWAQKLLDTSQDTIAGGGPEMEHATEEGVQKPVEGIFKRLLRNVVGGSIVPDMLRMIVQLFGELPGRLSPHLMTLYTLVTSVSSAIRSQWETDFSAMAQSAIDNLRVVAAAYTQAQQLNFASANLPQVTTPTANAQATVERFQDQLRNLPFGGALADRMNVNLNLDAEETRRLMEEGSYDALLNLFGGS